MIAINLTKKQAPDANPKAIQQINFTGNLDGANNRIIFFIIEETKEIDFSKELLKYCEHRRAT